MKKRRKKNNPKLIKLDSLEQINLNAAGLDIGSEEIWACVPEGRDTKSVRVFKTFTVELHHDPVHSSQSEVRTPLRDPVHS